MNPLGVKCSTAAGFRITACAATPGQAAFVLSVPRRRTLGYRVSLPNHKKPFKRKRREDPLE